MVEKLYYLHTELPLTEAQLDQLKSLPSEVFPVFPNSYTLHCPLSFSQLNHFLKQNGFVPFFLGRMNKDLFVQPL